MAGRNQGHVNSWQRIWERELRCLSLGLCPSPLHHTASLSHQDHLPQGFFSPDHPRDPLPPALRAHSCAWCAPRQLSHHLVYLCLISRLDYETFGSKNLTS